MKHLKSFKTFEAVIQPGNFDEFLEKLRTNKYNSLEELNNDSIESNIMFSDFDTFYDSLELDIEKQLAPKELMLYGGIKFALYNKYKSSIMIVVETDKFINFINNEDLTHMITFLNEILRHESIHSVQVDRMKDKSSYKLDSSPTHNSEKYWKEKRELMAYAQTLIDHMVQKGFDKEQIKSALINRKEIKSWVWNVYSKVLDESEMKRFMKYVYQYYETM